MAFFRQNYLFTLQDILGMDQENRCEAIFNCIDIAPLLHIAFPKYRYGPGDSIPNDHAAKCYFTVKGQLKVVTY